MKNIFNIVKKELDKIFHSPRLIFSTFILPGLLIFVMYSFMGSSAQTQANKNYDHNYKIVLNGVESSNFESILSNMQIDEKTKFKVTIDYLKGKNKEELLKSEEADIIISYNDNIDEVLSQETPGSADILLEYYSKNSYSSVISSNILATLSMLEEQINGANEFIITPTSTLDIATSEEKSSSFLAMLAPMLIMTFIFAGALSIGADSIAGEKERGTIATMLMAPISKNEIVFGKIISAIILTIIAAICSFIGLIASLSKLVSIGGDAGMELSLSLNFVTCIELLALIVLVSLVAVSLFLIASTYAKSTKEATMYAMPVYIIGIISGVFTMFETSVPTNLAPYFIPIYNLTLGLKGVFMGDLLPQCFLVIFLSNIVFFAIIIVIVKRMFASERIMFSK